MKKIIALFAIFAIACFIWAGRTVIDGVEHWNIGTLNVTGAITSTTMTAGTIASTGTLSVVDVLTSDSGAGALTAGAGITTATGEVYEATQTRVGNIVTTTIYIDLTSLSDGGDADDIIGKSAGTANCHIGQITAAGTGTIVAGWIDVGEVPAGGDPDIDLYSATVGTGAHDSAVADLEEAKLCDSGDLVVGTRVNLTALPAADGYLYLVNGDTTGDAYTAGKIVITLIGHID